MRWSCQWNHNVCGWALQQQQGQCPFALPHPPPQVPCSGSLLCCRLLEQLRTQEGTNKLLRSNLAEAERERHRLRCGAPYAMDGSSVCSLFIAPF